MAPSRKPSSASSRLQLTRSHLSSTTSSSHDDSSPSQKWNPNWNHFPSRSQVPSIPGAPAGASWFWGPNDNLGRLNLLTPKRVLAAKSEIRTGEMVNLDLKLDEPKVPSFGRMQFEHEILPNSSGTGFDDTYKLNTQSGTQWDGFRHFSHNASKTFYNGTKATDIHGPAANPSTCSIHHWTNHGIAGRAILLDYYSFALRRGRKYDPYSRHAISLDDLKACAAHQRVDIRPASQGGDVHIGDVLLIRSGFVSAYRGHSAEKAADLGKRRGLELTFAGVEQSWEMVDWLHDCYFSAVAGDAPAFECWPPQPLYEMLSAAEEPKKKGEKKDGDGEPAKYTELMKEPASEVNTELVQSAAGHKSKGKSAPAKTKTQANSPSRSDQESKKAEALEVGFLHEHILALWGMPLGEMFDLDELSRKCEARKKWTFFFTSSPANVVGGVGSHVNGMAIL